MGVKSTVTLSRRQAIDAIVDWELEAMRRSLEGKNYALMDTELEDKLERLNDAAHGGEGFENYIIND